MNRVRIGRGSYRLIPAEVIEGVPRERPILFSGPMVRAILAGRKTQTRRVVTPALPESSYRPMVGGWHPTKVDRHGEEYPGTEVYGAWWNDGEDARRCPFGEPGDRLWVRETWKAWPTVGAGDLLRVEYAAGGTLDVTHAGDWWLPAVVRRGGWAPSIHMPRWASRITLEITGVRVELLQDISEDDATAEGFEAVPELPWWQGYREDGEGQSYQTIRAEQPPEWMIDPRPMTPKYDPCATTARNEFCITWDALNRERGFAWSVNPWVWVIGFKRIEQSRAVA